MRYIKQKYFHRKVGSSSVLYPTVSTTVGTLRSRPPRQMALESSLVTPALSVRSRGAPGGDTLGRTLKLLFPLRKTLWVLPSVSVIVLYQLQS